MYLITRCMMFPITRAIKFMNNLLPDRYPNRDFFVADIFDALPKDDIGSMEHPIFSLSTTPDMSMRVYEHNGNTIKVKPSMTGIATIWDKDILIYCISQLMEGINRGREPSPYIRFTAYDMLKSTNRPRGGSDYHRLKASFERLEGTRIETNIITGGQRVDHGFGVIDYWKLIRRNDNDDAVFGIEIRLSDWLFNAVMGTEVLSISRDYFRLRGGLERRLYEIARKHCGNQARWAIGIDLLHKKSGSKGNERLFKSRIKKIVQTDHLPDYTMKWDSNKELVIFYSRKGSKAAKVQFDDQIDALNLIPSKRKESSSIKKYQAEFELD